MGRDYTCLVLGSCDKKPLNKSRLRNIPSVGGVKLGSVIKLWGSSILVLGFMLSST